MLVLTHGPRAARSVHRALNPAHLLSRSYASRISVPFTPSPVPVVDSCPAPTCQCRDLPPNLDIEREQNINGSMASYAEQILISTGRSDWKSRIEDEDEAVLVKRLKGLLGPKGKYSDPYHNVMITNSSFPPEPTRSMEPTAGSAKEVPAQPSKTASAYLLPSFQYIPSISTEPSAVENFVKAFILPSELHKSHDVLSDEQKNALRRAPERQRQFSGARPVNEVLVLICGHGGRDERCGKLGPVLQAEFEEKLKLHEFTIHQEGPETDNVPANPSIEGFSPTARVGLISHIGGHKWAGNIIVYIPPNCSSNALAGKGIWYGRVGPEHVEGIVAKTILEGKVIKELFRGGIDQNGKILRL
ncbi:Hypothetical protein R9X50_00381900 [Acrodontium crateriforme]|uniref:Altered inheritance of mitochondria protein 32 n=1 Tax=Acrodontium crateriforme TaxID=150365 RepID=A0AAQ3M455_9PEZI|nr:Hypothetical protein R9X50_00381900 [Acrodontium crateriforme]